jgi:hypothetical protein
LIFKRDACRNDTTIRMHIYVESRENVIEIYSLVDF